MLVPLLIIAMSAAPKLSDEQLGTLQMQHDLLADRVADRCHQGSCVRWKDRWVLRSKGVLVSALGADERTPAGKRWTDESIIATFPEFEPQVLAMAQLREDVRALWPELVRWLAVDPSRLDHYGAEMWSRFLAQYKPGARELSSPWGGPYPFDVLRRAGFTLDALKAAVAVLRCGPAADEAIAASEELRRPGLPGYDPIPADLFQKRGKSSAELKARLTDPWGTVYLLTRSESGRFTDSDFSFSGARPMRMKGLLWGWMISSAGADKKPGTSDDVNCMDSGRLYVPPGFEEERGVSAAKGPYDDALERRILRSNGYPVPDEE